MQAIGYKSRKKNWIIGQPDVFFFQEMKQIRFEARTPDDQISITQHPECKHTKTNSFKLVLVACQTNLQSKNTRLINRNTLWINKLNFRYLHHNFIFRMFITLIANDL